MGRLIVLAVTAMGLLGCPDWKWSPDVTPEDARVCAPAYYHNDCLRALGYKPVTVYEEK